MDSGDFYGNEKSITMDKAQKATIALNGKELKTIDEKYNDIELENVIKNFRIKKEIEDNISNNGFNKNIIAKVAYLKEAINAIKMCDIF